MKGLILAAGKGKRLERLTKTIPKALIPISGKPLITYPLLKFKKAGIKDMGIVIKPEDYTKFKSTLKIPGLKIKYIFQTRAQGTAKATQCACGFLENKRFLLCWCDFFSPFDFSKLIRQHLKFKPIATILINKEKNPSGTAQVLLKGPDITKITEKSKKRFSLWGATGFLVLEPEIFSVFPKVRASAKGEYHIADALQYLVEKGKKIGYLKIDTWRINVNTPEDLRQAEVKVQSFPKQIC